MTTQTEGLAAASHIGCVRLLVGDLDRQIEFYESVLGLATLERDGDTAVVGTGDSRLFAFHERPGLAERSAREAGMFHAAVRVPSRPALASALERVDGEWELTGASDHLVSEALYLTDPEGNGLEIYRDRPREAWPVEDDGSVAMEALPLDREALRAESEGTDRAPDGTTVGHVHLEVSDLAATRRFYAEGLGMRVRQTVGDDALFLAAGDYHHHVGANTWNGRTDPATGRGLDWFEVGVPNESDVAAARDRFEALGVSPTDLADGFAVTDPDGIGVRVRRDRA